MDLSAIAIRITLILLASFFMLLSIGRFGFEVGLVGSPIEADMLIGRRMTFWVLVITCLLVNGLLMAVSFLTFQYYYYTSGPYHLVWSFALGVIYLVARGILLYLNWLDILVLVFLGVIAYQWYLTEYTAVQEVKMVYVASFPGTPTKTRMTEKTRLIRKTPTQTKTTEL